MKRIIQKLHFFQMSTNWTQTKKHLKMLLLVIPVFFYITGMVITPIATINIPVDELKTTETTQTIVEEKIAGSSAKPMQSTQEIAKDIRVEKLKNFLVSRNSPLAEYAQTLVATADEYDLDWRWVAAISGVESGFGRVLPNNSHNAWGWGNGKIYFASWEDSINTVTKSLKSNYVDRGADTIYKIAPIYAPPSKSWGDKVTAVINQIENYSPQSSKQLALVF